MYHSLKRNDMKLLNILLASLMFVPAAGWAQRLVVSNSTIDCGQVAYQSPATVEFEVSNKGGKSLRIKDVKKSCGCTSVEYPHDEIVGGETFSVKVTYDGMTMGHFHKLVALYADNGDEPLVLHMKGVVVDEVEDYGGNMPFMLGAIASDINDIEFDDINLGDTPQQKIYIRNTTDKPIQPQVMHLPNFLKAAVAPTKILPGRSGVVTLTLNSKLLPSLGLNQTSVFLGAYPGDKVGPDKEITVSAVLLPNFEKLTNRQLALAPKIDLSATEINLPAFGSKSKQKATVVIKNVGKQVLDISNLRMFTSALQVSLNKTRLAPGEEAKLKVTVLASKMKSVRSKPRVLMITNDPDNPKVTIDVNVAK